MNKDGNKNSNKFKQLFKLITIISKKILDRTYFSIELIQITRIYCDFNILLSFCHSFILVRKHGEKQNCFYENWFDRNENNRKNFMK